MRSNLEKYSIPPSKLGMIIIPSSESGLDLTPVIDLISNELTLYCALGYYKNIDKLPEYFIYKNIRLLQLNRHSATVRLDRFLEYLEDSSRGTYFIDILGPNHPKRVGVTIGEVSPKN